MHIQYQQRGRSSRAVRSGWKSVALASLLAMGASSAALAADCRVTPDGTGDGSSWDQAANLHAALANANCSALWLREGTYKPVSDADSKAAVDAYAASEDDGLLTSNQAKYFAVTRPVMVYGGFRGDEAALPDRNGINAEKTVLSGDVNAPSTQAALLLEDLGDRKEYQVVFPMSTLLGPIEEIPRVDNSERIMVIGKDAGGSPAPATYTAANMLLDGLTFDGSVAEALVCDGTGVGNQCGLALNNVVMQNTASYGYASGLVLYADNDTAAIDLKITKSKFVNNLNGNSGGGAALGLSGEGRNDMVATVKIDQSEFRQNYTYGAGPAFYIRQPLALDLQISNATFVENIGSKTGASVGYVDCQPSKVCNGIVSHSLFEGNYARGGGYGTALMWSAGALTLSQSTFRNNRSYGMYGGKAVLAGLNRYEDA